ncbi:CAP domain-containing protein [Solibacillus sp. FSL R5-0449]|uniref:CAP domain-containing protein n=1 Tax=Solibacillus sp. FSL R5-0449 TaxID=2921639 RepID=UPI0030CE1FAB
MNKKWLATSLCAATLFATSITAANAADINKEENKGANTQHIQLIKGDHYQDLALKLIKQISVKGEFGILSKDAINQALVNLDTNKIVKEGKVVNTQKTTTNKEAQKETTAKTVEKEDKAPQAQAPVKEEKAQTVTENNDAKAPEASTEEKATPVTTNNDAKEEQVPTKETTAPETTTNTQATPVTNNNNTQAPSKSNNQQTEAPVKTTTNNASQSVSEFEKQVVDLTNAERTKAGLKPLEMHTPLMGVAHAKSADMAKNNYFSHTSPTFGSPFDQIKSAGISYRSAGENIAQGQRTPQQVVQAWMDSPGHRQNIMNANFTHIGVGFVEEGYYWTQQFIQL